MIMSKGEYQSIIIFIANEGYYMFIILQMFFLTNRVLKIGEYHLDISIFSWGVSSHVICLDQLRTNKHDDFNTDKVCNSANPA